MRFKFTAPSEKEIEEAILDYLNYQPGCFAFKVVTKGFFDPHKKRFLTPPYGVMKGTADILCCYQGKFIAFEVKADSGRQTESQKEFQKRLEHQGCGIYFIVRDTKEVETALKQVSLQTLQGGKSRPNPPPSS